MSKNEYDEYPEFVKGALMDFGKVMKTSHKGSMEDLNRPNKGEMFVLRFIAIRDREVLPSELREALNSSSARISALLNVLEKKGHITREVDVTNRRNILVSITPDGKSRVKEEMNVMNTKMAQIFTEMGETETFEFIRLLKKFAKLNAKADEKANG